MTKKKVALGMSGGVDSSLCAHLLTEQGYDVTGVYLECWNQPGCRSDADREDALKVAINLKIPFQVLDFTQEYQQNVIDDFFHQYQIGQTPNPDVLCNQYIKFGMFYDWAMANSFDAVATGHYAKIARRNDANRNTEEEFRLAIPKDKHKDQTYFLYRIRGQQLPQIIFPLAEMNKKDVRIEAKKRKLHVAEKKDSVGVCFIGNIDIGQMLEEKLGENPGEVVDVDGVVIGKHRGLWFYTIGQRSGFTINQTTLVKKSDGSSITKHNIPPFYVINKITKKNQLVVGFGPATLQSEFMVGDFHWINSKPDGEKLLVRIRHTGELLECELKIDQIENANSKIEDAGNKADNNIGKTGTGKVRLETPIRGIAPGQSAVFYQKQQNQIICLGGGVILPINFTPLTSASSS